MSSTETLYQARIETIEMIERGRDQVLLLRLYDNGALVEPIAGTISIFDASNNVIVNAQPIDASPASYSLLAADTTGEQLSEGWRIEWSVDMPDGTERVIRQDAALVRYRLLPAATWADVFRREPGLDPAGAHPIHSLTLTQLDTYLEEAWVQIEARLISNGRRPWLIMSPQALREVLIVGTLALIFQSFVTRLKGTYAESAAMYRALLAEAWAQVRFAYDADDDGQGDGGSFPDQVGGQTSIWLGSFGDASPRFTPWRF